MSSRVNLLLLLGALASCAGPGAAPRTLTAGGWWTTVEPRLRQDNRGFSQDGDAFSTTSDQGIVAHLDADGASLRITEDLFGVQLVSWGRQSKEVSPNIAQPELGDCLESGETLPEGDCARRLEIDRGDGLVEYWANRQIGLEQGWEIDAPPPGTSPLTFRLRWTGGTLDLDADGSAAWIYGDSGELMRYGDLDAWDADGEALDATFLLGSDGELLIEVDDTDAAWPITVDPLATSASTTLTGPTSGSEFGYAVSGAGDVNNDGYDDVVVGAYAYSTNTGRVYVYHGSSSGISSTARTTVGGPSTNSFFGYSVAGAGDVNNDGYDDIIVGAPGYGSSNGIAYIYKGSSSGVSSSVTTTLSSVSSGSQFGYHVAGAGDVNNDGYSDVIVGANFYSSGYGAAYTYHGSSSGLSTTVRRTITGSAGFYLGEAVAGAGDVDNDGYDDVIIGAPGGGGGRGYAYVYKGSSSGVGSSASATLSGSSTDSEFGESVASAGDVNGDGYGDVIVGAYGYSAGTGAAYVYHGKSTGTATSAATTLSARVASGEFGFSVAGAGDVDGDGYDDVIVSAPFETSGAGAVYEYPGSSSGVSTSADATLSGPGTYTYFGWSVASAGDVNGDGYGDVIVGADYASSLYGAAYVYLGQPGDEDGDGYDASEDCDDTDATIHPGATEVIADGVDEDCDGKETCYVDADGDRYRTSSTTTSSDGDCSDSGEATSSVTSGDCDDTDATINPSATEIPGDEIDENCDDKETCYADVDGDRYRTTTTVTSTDSDCRDSGEASSSATSGDCDDTDATINPGATEIVGDGIDEDCDDKETCYVDHDVDGYRTDTTISSTDDDCADHGEALSSDPDGDCDDSDDGINPGATEIPGDGIDQNCDGVDASDDDVDGDGHDTESSGGDDCDDTDATVYPGADEVAYDGVDQDCDGQDLTDVDGDGADAEAAGGDDCDDEDATVYPGAPEIDDGIDNDCDGYTELDDQDGDGLTDGYEDEIGTDPNDPDTDGDGVSDGDEVANGTDPLGSGASGEGEGEGEGEGDQSGQDGQSHSGGCSFGLQSYASLLLMGLGYGLRRRRARI